MGTLFGRNGAQTFSGNNLEAVLGAVHTPPNRVYAPYHRRGQNMESSQHTIIQAAAKTVSLFG